MREAKSSYKRKNHRDLGKPYRGHGLVDPLSRDRKGILHRSYIGWVVFNCLILVLFSLFLLPPRFFR